MSAVPSALRRVAPALVALAVLVGLVVLVRGGDEPTKTLVAHFDRTVGVYVENDVRILGVPVGKVTRIEPQGRTVRVEMEYDASYRVPADAQAVVVAPSIVSDRYVQLTPVYAGGDEVLADGADIPVERTATPVELDEIYAALDELNLALGPDGANRDGSLTRLLRTGAANLEGNGEALGTTLRDLSTAVATLSRNRDDLFGTVRNLQDFTTTLARNDDAVRAFNTDLAAVASQLSAERGDLGAALRNLSVALGQVAVFVDENREDLTANVTGLAEVTGVLVKQKRALEEFLDVAPAALGNLQLAYNPRSGTLDTRDNNSSGANGGVAGQLCTLLVTAGQPPSTCAAITDALTEAGLPPVVTGPPTRGAPVTAAGTEGGRPRGEAPRDLTLGGILEAGR